VRYHLFLVTLFVIAFSFRSSAQCEADHIVILNNFDFVPSELTIAPGETVAFVNIEGEHTLNGIANSITGEPFNNPYDIFIEETEGNTDGVCMGVVNFDTSGVFNFDCSVGYNAEVGMTLSITVDAFDLNDLMVDMYSVQQIPIFESYFVFSGFSDSLLTQSGQWTVFVPNETAVDEIMEYMNLNQFDMSSIPDFDEILSYHFAEGRWLAEDLYNGLQLPTAQGQSLNISQNEQGTFVNGATITTTDFEAYNGIIHVIDYCLAPQGMPEATVMEIIRQSDSHQILEQAIVATSLDDDLSAQAVINNDNGLPGPWTVFAPTDQAFEVLAEEMGLSTNELLTSQFIYDIINNHIVGYEIFGEDMYSGNVATTLEGEQIEFNFTDSTFFIIGQQNTVEVTVQDLYAYNGVVHIIDAVIKPNIPVLEGSCGVWRLVLQSYSDEGWGGNELYLYVNNEYIETLTIFEDTEPRIYEFGVDVEDKIDLYYVSNGGSTSNSLYKLFNAEEELLVNSNFVNNYGVASYTNIIACETFGEDHCGKIKVDLFNDFGGGWYGTLDVFRNGSFDQALTMPVGYWQVSYINANYNDTFDFTVNNPAFPEETAYIISNTEGQIVVDENELNTAPANSSDVLFCETDDNNTWNCVNDACTELSDESGLYSSLTECQELCGTSSIEENEFKVTIFPNPSTSIFNINCLLDSECLELVVTNTLGKKIIKKFLNSAGEYSTQIDLSTYPEGVYYLSLKTNKGISNHKLVFSN
jgi:uncharacterized surface protein with fasciclin (FAS1) repeats/plastocyanin